MDGSGVNCKVNYELNQKKFKFKNIKIEKKIKIEEDINAKIDIAKYLRLNLLLIRNFILLSKGFFMIWKFANLIFRLFNKIYFSNQKKAGN